LSLAHKQRIEDNARGAAGEVEEVVMWNSLEQFDKDLEAKPFVGPSNSTRILLPSDENTAFFIFGPGTSASELRTVKTEPRG
jgi:hypothetical protein